MVVPTSVSSAPLPDHVYSLPPNMQAQPSLTRFWCESCLVSLTTTSSKDPDGTVHGLARSMQVPGYCSRKTNFGICSGCAAAKNGSCVEISPEFRRAANILDFLVERALRKTNEQTVIASNSVDLADAMSVAIRGYSAEKKRLINESKLGEVGYQKARVASREHNIERYKAGLGTVGQKAALNVVVSGRCEQHFYKTGGSRNNERRWYYYSTDVPADDQVASLVTPSPSKRRLSDLTRSGCRALEPLEVAGGCFLRVFLPFRLAFVRLVSASADVQLLLRPDDVPAYCPLFLETRLVGCGGVNVAAQVQPVVLVFQQVGRFVDAIVTAHRVVMVFDQDVMTERQVLGDPHLPLPAQDSTGVELPVCGSLLRSARFPTRQRYMLVIGLITLLHLSNVIG
ncbi:hypothetical protein CC86DRAFT_380274 [Ophiobolus disseminans]|uniref:Uncharacterized protein n=1 Tax=Ophiobolus disseminans TaxID=1469910 RepID=A0A6A7A8H0_9PLEO|nr:hypothetical protein CC86DRAFT_380274 [Ophiobolus disseminans]